jgi:hypothetical protein
MRGLNARTLIALLACLGLVATCVGVGVASGGGPKDPRIASLGSVRQADCTDWKKGSEDQRETMVFSLRKFAGGPVGSSKVLPRGPVLDDDRAYRVLDSYCSRYFARGFKLYKLYGRAAAFLGH